MQARKLFHSVQPFISALAVVATAAILVATIYFTELDPKWITFLTGVLVAAVLAEATRISRAEWIVKRRTAQLSSLKIKFDREAQLRKLAEKTLDDSRSRLHLIDEVLPIMIALIDNGGRCQYHNRAFLDWLHLRPEQIQGRQIREVLGSNVYQETATAIRQSLDGNVVRYERTQKMLDGDVYRLSVEHLPQFAEDGKVSGFYMLIRDITTPEDVRNPERLDPSVRPGSEGAAQVSNSAANTMSAHQEKSNQDMFVDSYSDQIAGEHDASRILAAIEKSDFNLFCQLITPLKANSGGQNSGATEHYEILVRLKEEEEKLIPPGRFFPLAEKHGLMPHLDRWVVLHVAKWISRQYSHGGGRENTMFFINVSGATIADPGFPEFLQQTLQEFDIAAATLCFEIPNMELASRTAQVAEFARKVRLCGCRIAISGFGRDRVLFDLIRGFQIEFLKIDGSIILDIINDPVKLAKVTAINQVAKKIGVKTIAELVENDETIASLKNTGIDFAQGFGISRPRPLAG